LSERLFVLDCSVTMSWCFLDEVDAYAETVLRACADHRALVPQIWPVEVANALVTGQRRNRLQPAERLRFVRILQALKIEVKQVDRQRIFEAVVDAALANQLSAYDACYLELAMREGLPLASLDSKLNTAARSLGVKEFRV
jgi:predicted nucleic acid-binding protein